MPAEIKAVTALYDLGRAKFGRSIDLYVGWLNDTLRLPVPFTIFLAPDFDASAIVLKPHDKIVRVPMHEFYPMRWADRVEPIRLASTSKDLTFTLPNYALLMMSKFDMLERVAAEYGPDCKMVWVDAGASRFIRQDMAEGKVSASFLDGLKDATFAGAAPSWAVRQIREKSTDQVVGTSSRLITGSDFYATGAGAADAAKRLYDLVENSWLPRGKWDNEQIAMGCMAERGWPGFQIALENQKFASLVASLFSLQLHRGGLPGRIERWLDSRVQKRN